MKKHVAIYVTGLGDQKATGGFLFTGLFKLLGLRVVVYKMHWADKQPFEPKLRGLVETIDAQSKQGNIVSLIGVSAGASAALNAYAERKNEIHRVVYICGKLGGFEKINPSYFIKNPAFKDSVNQAFTNIPKLTDTDKVKMLSMQPLYDGLVPPSDTKIPGVRNFKILSVGHIFSILVAVTFYAPVIIWFIKYRRAV